MSSGLAEASPGSRLLVPSLAVALAALTLIAFWPVLGAGFVHYDDDLYVVQNAILRQGFTLEAAGWAFTTGYAANWHPLTWLSFLSDTTLWGIEARGFHATNLGLHTLDTVLFFVWLRGATGRLWESAFAAALFAIHPLRVESVAWVSQRKDVLSMAFALLALIAYTRHVQRPSMTRMAVVSIAFACALMAKPSVVTLPFVLLLLDYWPFRRSPSLGRLLREKAPLFLLCILSSVLTYAAQRNSGAVATFYPPIFRALNALLSYGSYLAKAILPVDLAVFYPQSTTFSIEALAASLLAIVALSIIALRLRVSRPYLPVGWLWFLGALVPMIGIVPVGAQAMADRYTYFPGIGLILMASFGAGDIARSRRLPPIFVASLGAALLALLLRQTMSQVRTWQDTQSLFEHALAVTGRNPVAFNLLLNEAINRSDREDAERLLAQAPEQGLPELWVHFDRGKLFAVLKSPAEALKEFDAALAIEPTNVLVRSYRGLMLGELDRNDDALRELNAVLEAGPENVPLETLVVTHRGLARVLSKTGRHSDALAHLAEAERIQSGGR